MMTNVRMGARPDVDTQETRCDTLAYEHKVRVSNSPYAPASLKRVLLRRLRLRSDSELVMEKPNTNLLEKLRRPKASGNAGRLNGSQVAAAVSRGYSA